MPKGLDAQETADVVASEDSVLTALLAARESRRQSRRTFRVKDAQVPVVRDGVTVMQDLEFDTQQIDADQMGKIRRQATKTGSGLQRNQEWTDDAELQCRVIVAATVPEQRKTLWGNQAYLRAFNVGEPWRMVNEVMGLGQIAQVFISIMEHSGLDDKGQSVEAIKSADTE
jgi:hypothetical protein